MKAVRRKAEGDAYAYSENHNLARGDVATLGKAVRSEPADDHNDLCEFSAVPVVTSAFYDSLVVRMTIRKSVSEYSPRNIQKQSCLFISTQMSSANSQHVLSLCLSQMEKSHIGDAVEYMCRCCFTAYEC